MLNIEGVKAAANNLKVVYPVVVEKGRATLTGTLTSRVARSHVHETLMHTPGVTDIEDQIQVVTDVFKKTQSKHTVNPMR